MVVRWCASQVLFQVMLRSVGKRLVLPAIDVTAFITYIIGGISATFRCEMFLFTVTGLTDCVPCDQSLVLYFSQFDDAALEQVRPRSERFL